MNAALAACAARSITSSHERGCCHARSASDLRELCSAASSRGDRRDRITGGGVTAGIDTALVIAAALFGESVAKEVQLNIEYAPDPPFTSGHPETADPALLARVQSSLAARLQERRRTALQAAAKLTNLGARSN